MATPLPNSRTLIRESWASYKAQFVALVSIAAVPTILASVLSYIAQSYFNSHTSHSVINGTVIPAQYALTPEGFFLAIIGTILAGLASLWGYASIVNAVKERTTTLEPFASLQKGLQLLRPLLFTMIIVVCATVGGLILLIVPGIIVTFWSIFAVMIVVAEGETGIAAMEKSRHYMKNMWGAVLWRLFCLALVSILVVIVGGIIYAMIVGPALVSGGISSDASVQLSALILLPLQILFIPFGVLYVYRVYEYVRDMKSGESAKPEVTGWMRGFAWLGGVVLAVLIVSGLSSVYLLNIVLSTQTTVQQ